MKLNPLWLALVVVTSIAATRLLGDPPEVTHHRIAITNAAFGECFLSRIHQAAEAAGLTVEPNMVPGRLASDREFLLALPALIITLPTGHPDRTITVTNTTGIDPGQRLSIGLHLRVNGGSAAPNTTVTFRLRNSDNTLLTEVITPIKKDWQVASLIWTADTAIAAGSIRLEILIETPSSILLSFPTGIVLPQRNPQ